MTAALDLPDDDAYVARAAFYGNLDLMGGIIEVGRLVVVVACFAEARVDNRFAQPGCGVNASCEIAWDAHDHVTRAAIGVEDVATCEAATDLDGHIARARPGSHTKVNGVVGQNQVHVAPAGFGREAGDGHAGQVQLHVAAIAVGCYVRRGRGIEMDLPLGSSVASRPWETEPGPSSIAPYQREGSLPVFRNHSPGGRALFLEILQRAGSQQLLAARKAVDRQIAVAGMDIDPGSRGAVERLRKLICKHVFSHNHTCFFLS